MNFELNLLSLWNLIKRFLGFFVDHCRLYFVAVGVVAQVRFFVWLALWPTIDQENFVASSVMHSNDS